MKTKRSKRFKQMVKRCGSCMRCFNGIEYDSRTKYYCADADAPCLTITRCSGGGKPESIG